MSTWPGWQAALLKRLGAPATPNNLRFLNAWQAAEGGTARFNPFNTTLPMQGASAYNSVGVRNYASPEAGIDATLRTLQGRYPHYNQILGGLQAGNVPWQSLAAQVEASPWGTHNITGAAAAAPTGGMTPAPTGILGGVPGASGEAQGGSPQQQYVAGLLAGQFARNQETLGGSTEGASFLQTLLAGRRPDLPAHPQIQAAQNDGVSYPLGRRGKIIGVPYQGTHRLYNNWESDNAVDIAAPVGTPVYALRSGVIGSQIGSLGSGDARLAGQRVHLKFGDNEAYYAHLSRLVVKAGQRVQAGQLIGYSGSANGTPHLHLAVRSGDPRTIVA